MSPIPPKDRFLIAAKALNWKIAYDECNGLNMVDMLDVLQEIGPQLLRDMRAQMAIYDVWGGPFMARIRFAMDVVELRQIPQIPDKLLPVDQVQNARDFLAHSSGLAKTRLRPIRVTLFWTEAARTESLSTRLVQKASDLLRQNNTGFYLEVSYFRRIIDLKGEVFDSTDVENAISLAKQASSYAVNRLVVIFCRTTPLQCDPNRQRCARLPMGTTPSDGAGRPFVFINVANPHPDNGTLLHEIGHAAGIDSRDSDDALKDLDDIMSYGPSRTKVGFNQVNKLTRSGLFFVGR
jgi:hypothetical protein